MRQRQRHSCKSSWFTSTPFLAFSCSGRAGCLPPFAPKSSTTFAGAPKRTKVSVTAPIKGASSSAFGISSARSAKSLTRAFLLFGRRWLSTVSSNCSSAVHRIGSKRAANAAEYPLRAT